MAIEAKIVAGRRSLTMSALRIALQICAGRTFNSLGEALSVARQQRQSISRGSGKQQPSSGSAAAQQRLLDGLFACVAQITKRERV